MVEYLITLHTFNKCMYTFNKIMRYISRHSNEFWENKAAAFLSLQFNIKMDDFRRKKYFFSWTKTDYTLFKKFEEGRTKLTYFILNA